MFGGQSLADSAQVHSAFGWRVEFAGPDELRLGAFPTGMESSASAAPRSLTSLERPFFFVFGDAARIRFLSHQQISSAAC